MKYFDENFYKKFYFNLKLEKLSNFELFKHYIDKLTKEEVFGSEEEFFNKYSTFDLNIYNLFNTDLHLFKNDKYLLMNHYHSIGYSEERISCEEDFYNKYTTFDLNIYNLFNIDLHLFKNDKYLLMKHYHIYGKIEYRISSKEDIKKNIDKFLKQPLLNISYYEKNNKKNIFHISHYKGGGIDIYISNLINIYNNYNHFILKIINESFLTINDEIIEYKDLNIYLDNCESPVFIHSLLELNDIINIPIYKLLINNNSIKKILFIHDYYLLLPSNPHHINKYSIIPKICDIEMSNLLLNNCEKVIFNSNNCYINFKNYIPNLNKYLILNNIPDIDFYNKNTRDFPIKKENYNIGLLGRVAIDEHKGKKLLEKILSLFENNEKYKFIIFGESNLNKTYKNVLITGKYENENIFKIISERNIDYFLFLSIVEETYSFTLSIALKIGLPIIYNNIGSYSERLNLYNNCFSFLEKKYTKIPRILDFIENNYINTFQNTNKKKISINNNEYILYKNIPELSDYLRHNNELNIDLTSIKNNLLHKNICFINLFNIENTNSSNNSIINCNNNNNLTYFNKKIKYIKDSKLYEKLDYIFIILLGNHINIMCDYKIKVIFYSPNIKENKNIIYKIIKYFVDQIPFQINVLNIDFENI